MHSVTRRDNRILISASDNVQVTQVLVTISDDEGQTLEQGQATLIYDGYWEYTTSAPAAIHVTVEAFDLPGNITKYQS